MRVKRTVARLAPWQVKVAREIMSAHLAGSIDITEVAERLDISVNHFIRAFRQSEGMSPYQWYMNQRIGRAMALMWDGVPIAKVAVACGFANQSHFTKAFTRVSGVSPGRWRRARGM